MKIASIAQYSYFKGLNNLKNGQVSSFGNNISKEKLEEYSSLRVFNHHIYEYSKGLRSLVLTTEKAQYQETIEQRLQKENINYVIHKLDNGKINVYFGDKPCIDVVKTFNPKLNHLSAEQDFMLGIMLGYDKTRQCERYLNVKAGKIKLGPPEE